MKTPISRQIVAVASLCLMAPALQAAEPVLPELAAYRVEIAPVIDGKLDDACWGKAASATDFWNIEGSARIGEGTTAQIAFDDNNLYVAYRCPVKDTAAVKAAQSLKEDEMFGPDTVELFLGPYADNAVYYHFGVNAANGRFAALNFGYPWTNPWQSATSIDAQGWNAEIKIPFASFATNDGAPTPNWRLNVTRGASTWAPTFTRFHQPALFGKLTGITAPLDDYRWYIAAANGDSTQEPSVALQLYHNTQRTRNIKYSLEVTGPEANAKPWRFQGPALSLPVLTNKTLEVPVAGMTRPEPYIVQVTVSEADSGRALAYGTATVDGPRPATTVWNRSFYMTEAAAKLGIACRGKGASLGMLNCILQPVGKKAAVQTVAVRLDKQGRGSATFKLAALAAGNYEVRLQGAKGWKFESLAQAPLQKLKPKAGAVQFTDKGVLLRDGKPMFPVGLYYVRQGFPVRKGLMDEYASAGFNTYPMEWSSPAGFVNEVREQKPRGVVPIVGIQNSTGVSAIKYEGPQSLDAWEKATRELVKEVSTQAGDNILAWYTWDEPPLGIWYQLVKRLHTAAKQEDPYHPTMVVSNNPGIFKPYATDATDILAVDPYPGFPGGRMAVVPDWIDAAVKAAGSKPVIAVLQAFYEPGGRMPTPLELRNMTYASILHGAKGVLYFSYLYQPGPIPDHSPETWQALKDLAAELKVLEPSLVSHSASGASFTRTGAAGIEAKLCGDYLIVLNNEDKTSTATFTVKKSKQILKSLPVFGEKRSVALKEGRFTDSFAPYAVHIYKIP